MGVSQLGVAAVASVLVPRERLCRLRVAAIAGASGRTAPKRGRGEHGPGRPRGPHAGGVRAGAGGAAREPLGSVRADVCANVCAHARVCVFVRVCMCTCVRVHECAHACVCVLICVDVCVCAPCMCVHVCVWP